MRSLALGNSDRALHEPLGLRPAPEKDVLLEPEEVDVTKEEALAALLNEPEPPSGSEHSMKGAPKARVAVDHLKLICQTAAFDVLAARFGIEVVDADTKELLPLHKAAPSQLLPIVIAPDGRRRLLPARWGFRPSPSRYGKIAPTHVRADVVVTRQVFRDTLRFTRCLVPADGFYVWTSIPGQRRKQSYFRLKGGKLFAFAGLYTPPHPEEGTPATFAIITTIANEVAAPIHRRVPVLLDPSDERRWLNPFFVTPTDVLRCLLPPCAECMEVYPVSTLVPVAPEMSGANSWSLPEPRRGEGSP